MNDRPDHPRRRISKARELRQAATTPERLLWSILRDGQLGGHKFRRQHPVGPFVLDFYCHAAALGFEIDGRSHEERAIADARRTAYLESIGISVVRFTNDEVLSDLDAVGSAILLAGSRKLSDST
jgi:very-short-patch-repair endonuclease